MKKQLFTLFSNIFFVANAFSAVLTPNEINKSANLPAKYDTLIFKLSDGNWQKNIRLPNAAQNNATIRIISTAKTPAYINNSNLLFPSTYTVHAGSDFLFKYKTKLKKWVPENINAYVLNANHNLNTDVNHIIKLKALDAPITEIRFSNNHWVSTLGLPQSTNNRDRVIFTSTATKNVTILNRNTNTQATLRLQKGNRYEFMYVSEISKWVLMSSPKDVYQAKNLSNKQIPNMTKPQTVVKISNGNWQPVLNLPIKASIGDKVIFNSSASYSTTITAKNGLKKTLLKDEKQRYRYTASGWVSDSSTIDILLISDPDVVTKLGATAAKLRLYESLDITNNVAQRSDAQFYIRPVGYSVYKVPVKVNYLSNVLDRLPYDTFVTNERKRVQADAVYYETRGKSKEVCGIGNYQTTPTFDSMFTVGSSDICDPTTMVHEIGHNLGLDHEDGSGINKAFSSVLGATTMASFGGKFHVYTNPKLYYSKYGLHLGKVGKMDQVKVINRTSAIASKFF